MWFQWIRRMDPWKNILLVLMKSKISHGSNMITAVTDTLFPFAWAGVSCYFFSFPPPPWRWSHIFETWCWIMSTSYHDKPKSGFPWTCCLTVICLEIAAQLIGRHCSNLLIASINIDGWVQTFSPKPQDMSVYGKARVVVCPHPVFSCAFNKQARE